MVSLAQGITWQSVESLYFNPVFYGIFENFDCVFLFIDNSPFKSGSVSNFLSWLFWNVFALGL